MFSCFFSSLNSHNESTHLNKANSHMNWIKSQFISIIFGEFIDFLPFLLQNQYFIVYKIDLMGLVFLFYPRAIIWAILMVFRWFYLGWLHRPRLPLCLLIPIPINSMKSPVLTSLITPSIDALIKKFPLWGERGGGCMFVYWRTKQIRLFLAKFAEVFFFAADII